MLAGVIVDHLSIQWIFWLSVLVTTLAAWATWRFVPESPVRVDAKIDWVGAALLSLALASLLLGVSQGNAWGWESAGVLGLFAAAAIFGIVFIAVERRVPEPMVDMEMMSRRPVWSTNLTAFAIGFAMFGSYVLIPQLVELPAVTGYGFAKTTTVAGLVLLPSALVMLGAGPLSGWLGHRFGSRLPLALGGCLRVAGLPRGWRCSTTPWPRSQSAGSGRHRHRPGVRGDGEPRGRSRAPGSDGCRHGDQHDHALDRRLGRRADRGGDHRRQQILGGRYPGRERLHRGIRDERRRGRWSPWQRPRSSPPARRRPPSVRREPRPAASEA